MDKKQFKDELAASCPELREMPAAWDWTTGPDGRIVFIREGEDGKKETTYTHPTYGRLPQNWILKLIKQSNGKPAAAYFNRKTGVTDHKNPRQDKDHLSKMSNYVSKDLRVSSSAQRMAPSRSTSLGHMIRTPMLDYNIRDNYELVHVIDDGSGTKGGSGFITDRIYSRVLIMEIVNSGVFVVRLKSNPSK